MNPAHRFASCSGCPLIEPERSMTETVAAFLGRRTGTAAGGAVGNLGARRSGARCPRGALSRPGPGVAFSRRDRSRHGMPSLVITFEPQPMEFFRPDQAPARLTRLREKLSAIRAAGIDQVNQAITSMDEMTQQNAALAEQTSADLIFGQHAVLAVGADGHGRDCLRVPGQHPRRGRPSPQSHHAVVSN